MSSGRRVSNSQTSPNGFSGNSTHGEIYGLACKVMLIGDSGVGKTCLLVRFKDNTFLSGSFISTVGIDFRNKVVDVDGTKVKLQCLRIMDNNLDPPNNVDFAFDRVEDVVRLVQRFYAWLSKALKIKERQVAAKQFMADHPIPCLFIGVAMMMCSVPIFCFFIFAVTTAVILFLGFLLVEGAVIACGLVVLFGILFFVTFLSIGCTLLILFFYYVSTFLRQLTAEVRQRLSPQDVGSHVE